MLLKLFGFRSQVSYTGLHDASLDQVRLTLIALCSRPPLNMLLIANQAVGERAECRFQVGGVLNVPQEFVQASIRRFSVSLISTPTGATRAEYAARAEPLQFGLLLFLIPLLVLLLMALGAIVLTVFERVFWAFLAKIPSVPDWIEFLIAAALGAVVVLCLLRYFGRLMERRGRVALAMVGEAVDASLDKPSLD